MAKQKENKELKDQKDSSPQYSYVKLHLETPPHSAGEIVRVPNANNSANAMLIKPGAEEVTIKEWNLQQKLKAGGNEEDAPKEPELPKEPEAPKEVEGEKVTDGPPAGNG